jgi:mRNA interferase MazF
MGNDRRGEVWLVDLGYVAKTRPALVISVPAQDSERALVALVPHTTSLRGTRYEVTTSARYLKAGTFDAQNLVTVSESKMLRRLGRLSDTDFDAVVDAASNWLGLKPSA